MGDNDNEYADRLREIVHSDQSTPTGKEAASEALAKHANEK